MLKKFNLISVSSDLKQFDQAKKPPLKGGPRIQRYLELKANHNDPNSLSDISTIGHKSFKTDVVK